MRPAGIHKIGRDFASSDICVSLGLSQTITHLQVLERVGEMEEMGGDGSNTLFERQ